MLVPPTDVLLHIYSACKKQIAMGTRDIGHVMSLHVYLQLITALETTTTFCAQVVPHFNVAQ